MDKNTTDFDYYLHTKRLSESTRRSIIKQVAALESWLEGEQIQEAADASYNDMMAYVKLCSANGNTQKTINLKLIFLNHYFKWLIKAGEINENPVSNIKVQGIKRKKLHQLFKMEELEKIYNDFQPSGATGARNKVMLALVIYQGLRMDEITSLTQKDIQLKDGKIRVHGGRRTNGRTLRLESFQVVELLEYMAYSRKELIELTGKETDRLFISAGAGEYLYNTFQYLLAQLKKQNTRIKDWKQIRASVLCNWITTYNLRKTQYMAGHKYVSSTEQYKQQDLDGLQADVDQFHPLK